MQNISILQYTVLHYVNKTTKKHVQYTFKYEVFTLHLIIVIICINFTFLYISFVVFLYSTALKNKNNIRTLLNDRHVEYKKYGKNIFCYQIATFHYIPATIHILFFFWIIPEPSFRATGHKERGLRVRDWRISVYCFVEYGRLQQLLVLFS